MQDWLIGHNMQQLELMEVDIMETTPASPSVAPHLKKLIQKDFQNTVNNEERRLLSQTNFPCTQLELDRIFGIAITNSLFIVRDAPNKDLIDVSQVRSIHELNNDK